MGKSQFYYQRKSNGTNQKATYQYCFQADSPVWDMHLMNWLEHVNMKDPEYLDVIIHLNILALITLRPQELAWKD